MTFRAAEMATGICAGLLLSVYASSGFRPAGKEHSAAEPRASSAVEIEMRNVDFRVARDIILHIRSLRGRLEPTGTQLPVTFDDRNSFIINIDAGEMSLGTSDLSRLLNTYVFAYPNAPLKNISVATKGDRITQKGTLHKGVDLPFEIDSTVSATADGNIRLHTDKIKSAHIPFKGLLHLLGEDLSKLINLNEAHGVRVEGDDILMFPDRMLPPPHIRGRITAVRVEAQGIVEVFGGARKSSPLVPPKRVSNYIYHRGGVLRFGKLTMNDADLEIVDENPKTPFDFFLGDYNRQLIAGYSKNTASHGLIVHMPDYSQLARP